MRRSFLKKKESIWNLEIKSRVWKSINEINTSNESFQPKLHRHGGLMQKSENAFHEMSMYSFCPTGFLWCMRARGLRNKTMFSK